MGIVVVVRTRGRIVRRLELGGVRVARRETGRVLAFIVSNRGNVTETLTGARAVLSRPRSGRRVGTLVASKRDLRPLTSGILEFRLGASAPGRIAVRVVIPPEPGRDAVQRSYRIRL